MVLLATGLNNYKRRTASARLPETSHDIVEKYNLSSNDKDCMFDDCAVCSSGKLCQLPDSNPDSESDLDSDSDASCLVFFYRWETSDKHVTIYTSVSHLRKLLGESKNPLCLSGDIFTQKDPKTIIIIT